MYVNFLRGVVRFVYFCFMDWIKHSFPLSFFVLFLWLICGTVCGAKASRVSVKPFGDRATVLPEIVVKPRKYKMLHLIGYVREFSTLSTYYDTIQLFREKTVDFMVPARGGKGGWLKPRVLASRSYYRFANYEGLDSVSDRFREHFSWSDWAELFSVGEIPGELRAGGFAGMSDTVFYRGAAVTAVWHKVDDDSYMLDADLVADGGNRRWLPGFASFLERENIDFRHLKVKYYFTDVESGHVYPGNVDRFEIDVRSGGRGRDLRNIFHTEDTIYVDTHAEFYITDREYLSSSDAGRWTKSPPRGEAIGIHPPFCVPEVYPLYAEMVERVERIDHAKLRIEAENDKLLIGPRYYNLQKKNYGPVGKLWQLIKKLPLWVQKHI